MHILRTQVVILLAILVLGWGAPVQALSVIVAHAPPVFVHILVDESRFSDATIIEELQAVSNAAFSHVESVGGFGRPERPAEYGKRLFSVSLPSAAANGFVARLQSHPRVITAEIETFGVGDMSPNDPYYSQQWGMAKIDASEAFEIETGNAGTVIAVIDTGVDLDHPDLLSKLLPGFDAVDEDNIPEDDHGHGTRMAGIAAAATMNAQGIAGTCPDCRILPVRAGYNSNGNSVFSAVRTRMAFAYALGNPSGIEGIPQNPNPADVISFSASFTSPSSFLLEAVEDAASMGVPVVASAGNQASDVYRYPAAYPGVISVAATDQNDQRWSGSNYGGWVTLAAPGVDIWTTSLEGGYTTSTGTSPAAPFVAGTIALMQSQAGQMVLTPEMISEILIQSSDAVSGFPDIIGGRVNAREALLRTPSDHIHPKPVRLKSPLPYEQG